MSDYATVYDAARAAGHSPTCATQQHMTLTNRCVCPTGACLACGADVPLVNFRRDEFGPGHHGGYVGRHHRKGTRAGTKCAGSFGAWAGKR